MPILWHGHHVKKITPAVLNIPHALISARALTVPHQSPPSLCLGVQTPAFQVGRVTLRSGNHMVPSDTNWYLTPGRISNFIQKQPTFGSPNLALPQPKHPLHEY
jgi:hypothetical protein